MENKFERAGHPHHALMALRSAKRKWTKKEEKEGELNTKIGVAVTNGVGTMWCAYAFAMLALISLPDAIHQGRGAIIAWIAQTFLQLVLLSIIMVGQKVAGAAADKRADETYKDAEAILHESLEIHRHLEHQDEILVQQNLVMDTIIKRLQHGGKP
jgi:hypothetical protein